MTEKFAGVYVDEETLKKFKIIAAREGTTLKELHKTLLLDYIKIHGEGNPNYSLDKWDDPNFMATPAFFSDSRKWNYWLGLQKPKDLQAFKIHLHMIDGKMCDYL